MADSPLVDPASMRDPTGGEGLEGAQASLADALRKSFRVLKLVMIVLVALYFLSGWFSVKPSEVGIILRFGGVTGEPAARAVLTPGWHWSWPYPIERWETVSTSERELPVEFLFHLTDEERTGGISGYKYNDLRPDADDFLITGDVNILHASLTLKYKIGDAVAYLRNVKPEPDPAADARSKPYRRHPEFRVLQSLFRDSIIKTAATFGALEIRGSQQDRFLLAVGRELLAKLKALDDAGAPLGLFIDPDTCVLAPKSSTLEAIFPPRQTQEVFDKVFAVQSERAVTITKAATEAQQQLLKAAGPDYDRLARATNEEFDALRKLRAAVDAKDAAETARLERALAEKSAQVEALLSAASGEARATIQSAQRVRDQTIKEASGEYDQFVSMLPEYLKNPDILISRLRSETFADALSNPKIAKIAVPPPPARVWLQIPRSSKVPGAEKQEEPEKSSRLLNRPKLLIQ